MRRQRLGHPRLDLFARLAEREDTLDIGAVRAPSAVLGPLVDDEIVVHRSSSSPVVRRIAAGVPAANRIGLLTQRDELRHAADASFGLREASSQSDEREQDVLLRPRSDPTVSPEAQLGYQPTIGLSRRLRT